MRIRPLAAVAAVFAAAPFAVVLPATAAVTEDTPISVLHLIPLEVAEVVDVVVDGEVAIDDLAFEDDSVPTALPPGDYTVEVYTSDFSDNVESEPLISQDFTVGTAPLTIVAQLDADGAPVLVAYEDDLSETEAGKARVTIRHAAAAPAVDIAVNDTPGVVEGLENGAQASLETPAGTYSVETSLSESGDVVDGLSAEGLDLEAGVAYFVYAYSIPAEDTENAAVTITVATAPEEDETEEAPKDELCLDFALFVEFIEVGEESVTTTPSTTKPAIPTGVPAGEGTSGWSGPLAAPAMILIGVGALLALAVGMTVRGSVRGSHR